MRIAVAGGAGAVGKYVVLAASQAGHDVVSISRSTGVDVQTGVGLSVALQGVDVIIDTTNCGAAPGPGQGRKGHALKSGWPGKTWLPFLAEDGVKRAVKQDNETKSVQMNCRGAATGDDRVVDGMPVAPEFRTTDLAHASRTPAHLLGDPTTGLCPSSLDASVSTAIGHDPVPAASRVFLMTARPLSISSPVRFASSSGSTSIVHTNRH